LSFTGRATGAVLALLLLLGLAAASQLPTIQDEAYYWTWSRALAGTYYDHPPGIAWVMAGSTAIFGDGWFGLRAPSILSVIAVLALSFDAGRRRSPRAPILGGCLCVLLLSGAPMFAVGYWPGTHDPLLGLASAAFAWLVCYALSGAIAPAGGKALLGAGFVLVAAGILKHSAAVLALGALLGALRLRLFSRDPRSRTALLGAALGLLVLTPWLLAERAQGADSSIAFQAAHVFSERPTRGPIAILLTVGSMIATLGPLGAAALLLLGPGRIYRANAADPAEAILCSAGLTLVVFCTIAVWAGSGESNWPMPALVISAPVLGPLLAERWARSSVALGLVSSLVCLVLLAHAAWPFLPVRISRDPTARGAGFQAMSQALSQLAGQYQARAILTRRYQIASLLRYHLRDQRQVVELGTQRRKSQYDRWKKPPLCPGDTVILLLPEKEVATEVVGEVVEELRMPRMRRASEPAIDIWVAKVVRLGAGLYGCGS